MRITSLLNSDNYKFPSKERFQMATTYLLSVYGDESQVPTGEAMNRLYKQVDEVNTQLRESGAWLYAGGLEPSKAASVYRPDSTVTDGPYAETKEVLGGFWVIKTETEAEAQEWARKCAAACEGPVELRPFQPDGVD